MFDQKQFFCEGHIKLLVTYICKPACFAIEIILIYMAQLVTHKELLSHLADGKDVIYNNV